MFNVDWVSSFRSAVSTQRFVDAFKKQASSRYRSKIGRFLQVANSGLILFATGPPDLGKIQLGYPERRSCSTSDFEPLTSVIDHEHEFVIRAWVIPSSFNASPARTIRASSFLLLSSAFCPCSLLRSLRRSAAISSSLDQEIPTSHTFCWRLGLVRHA